MQPMTPCRSTRFRVNAGLYLLTLIVACACLAGAIKVAQTHGDRADDRLAQERYGAVLAAATTEANAFVNIDHEDAEASFQRVADGATGEFKKQYDTSTESVARVLKDNESVMTGDVLWAGVASADSHSATVLVATKGTVSNTQSKNQPIGRSFRLQLELEKVDGVWLTADLKFVE